MDTTGSVNSFQKISSLEGNFNGDLDNKDVFGSALDGLGDINGDGVPDIIVGAYLDDDGQSAAGAVWLITLNNNGTVQAQYKISSTEGDFNADIDKRDFFGSGVSVIGDLDFNCIPELIVGATKDDPNSNISSVKDHGAFYVIWLEDLNLVMKSEERPKVMESSLIDIGSQPTSLPEQAQETVENISGIFISVFPNPASDEVHLKISKERVEETTLRWELINMYGVKIQEEEIQFSLEFSSVLDVSKLGSGQYVLKMMIDGTSINRKFMVLK
jgi:hypothetical protein